MYKGYKIAALCISRIYEEEKSKLVMALNKRLTEAGFRLFIYNTCTDLYWNTPAENGEKRIYELLDYSITDAVIIHSESLKDAELKNNLIKTARTFRKPVFVIDGDFEDCINIKYDYEDGFAQIIRHVIDCHGCKELHMLSGIKGNGFSEARENVFRRVLEEYDLAVDDNSISYGEFWRDPAKAAVEKLFEREKLPEAIVCANDAMAIAACTVMEEHGVKVPDDIVITGFDGIEEIFFFSPTITSCRYSYANLAEKIAELLAKSQSGETISGYYYVGEEMILNESCGCRGGSRINAADYVANLGGRLYRYQSDDCTFYERVAAIQCLDSIDDIYNEFKKLNLYGMSCMLNSECTDETVNPLDIPYGESYSGDMYLLYKYDVKGTFRPVSFSKTDIAPDMDYMLDEGYPLIFNALNFRDVPLGYMCFYFAPSLEEYCRIPQIVNAFNIAVGGFRNVRYQKYITNRIDEFSKRDMLTGLYNRKGFMHRFDEMMKSVKDGFSVISIDLDKLKFINDSFGHTEGDSAIRAFAGVLEKGCPGRKICGRFGGDEFAAVTDCTDEDMIKNSIEKCISEYNSDSGKPYELSASMGVAVQNPDNAHERFEDIFKRSDRLMYEEKRRRKSSRI